MTTTLKIKNLSDLSAEVLNSEKTPANAEALAGRWLNTNSQTRGIAEVSIEQDAGTFIIKIVGVGADGPILWPAARATPFASLEEEGGQRSVALAADFDFGFMKAESFIRVNKGVLVIVLLNSFRDGSGRSNYVTREFFYRPA
jgi:hypothetical protein